MISNGDGINEIRYDTKENWELYNPILEKGELAVEKIGDIYLIKCGDGVNAWNNLPYVSSNKFNTLEQIGIITGKETLNLISQKLPINSEISYTVTPSTGHDTSIYPSSYGVFTAKHSSVKGFVEFKYLSIAGPPSLEYYRSILYTACLPFNNSTYATKWMKYTNEAV